MLNCPGNESRDVYIDIISGPPDNEYLNLDLAATVICICIHTVVKRQYINAIFEMT